MATQVMDEWVSRVLGVAVGAPDGAGGTLSVMRLGKARVEWIGTRRTAVTEIARLRDAIATEFRDDAEQAAQLSAALSELSRRIAELDPTLEEQLDAVLNADPADRGKLMRPARGTLQRFINFLDTDDVMVELDGNEVLPDMVVVAPMRAVLSDIQSAMG